jgi:hypothetical protein
MKLTPTLDALLDAISVQLDRSLVEPVFEEYAGVEQRFYMGDWSPAECNAGRFCEALVAPLGMLDRGIVPNQSPGKFAQKLVNQDIPHKLDSNDRKNISRVIASVYEIRSSRNSVHLAPGYTADYVDSMYVLSSCKWMLCEFVRLATGKNNEETARLLRGIAQLGDPVIFEVAGRAVVMKTDLSAPQEILILLLNRPGYQAKKSELISLLDGYIAPNNISMSLRRLHDRREVVKSSAGTYHLSTLGKQSALQLLGEK